MSAVIFPAPALISNPTVFIVVNPTLVVVIIFSDSNFNSDAAPRDLIIFIPLFTPSRVRPAAAPPVSESLIK